MLQALLALTVLLVGAIKAVGVIWVGLRIGAPSWAIAITAALWATGPGFAAWAWRYRQQLRASVVEVARPESAG